MRIRMSGAVAVLFLAAFGCHRDRETNPVVIIPVAMVRGVEVRPNPLNIPVGAQALLTATVDADASITDRAVIWSSNSPSVTVSAEGVVTGVAGGSAIVTARAHADPDVRGATTVTVFLPGASSR